MQKINAESGRPPDRSKLSLVVLRSDRNVERFETCLCKLTRGISSGAKNTHKRVFFKSEQSHASCSTSCSQIPTWHRQDWSTYTVGQHPLFSAISLISAPTDFMTIYGALSVSDTDSVLNIQTTLENHSACWTRCGVVMALLIKKYASVFLSI